MQAGQTDAYYEFHALKLRDLLPQAGHIVQKPTQSYHVLVLGFLAFGFCVPGLSVRPVRPPVRRHGPPREIVVPPSLPGELPRLGQVQPLSTVHLATSVRVGDPGNVPRKPNEPKIGRYLLLPLLYRTWKWTDERWFTLGESIATFMKGVS